MTLRVAVVGCGLMGRRRSEVVRTSADSELVAVADIDKSRAIELAQEMGCAAEADWRTLVDAPGIDAIVVSTPNIYLAPITIAALHAGKHVLCEKPPGRNLAEALQMDEAARRTGRALKIGFSLRYHPAIQRAHEVCSTGRIGPLLFVRAIYGHGGRIGFEKEWRGNGDLAGGGELLDQGVHIVDLCRWFLGEFSEVTGMTSTYFWDLGYFPKSDPEQESTRLEDNAFATLRTPHGQIAQFHTSWTQWENRFSFEVFGRDGHVRLEGLGGTYGVERLTFSLRNQDTGFSEEEEFREFPGPDVSWKLEWTEFVSAVSEQRQPDVCGSAGVEVMRIIAGIYESAATGRIIRLADNSVRP